MSVESALLTLKFDCNFNTLLCHLMVLLLLCQTTPYINSSLAGIDFWSALLELHARSLWAAVICPTNILGALSTRLNLIGMESSCGRHSSGVGSLSAKFAKQQQSKQQSAVSRTCCIAPATYRRDPGSLPNFRLVHVQLHLHNTSTTLATPRHLHSNYQPSPPTFF